MFLKTNTISVSISTFLLIWINNIFKKYIISAHSKGHQVKSTKMPLDIVLRG